MDAVFLYKTKPRVTSSRSNSNNENKKKVINVVELLRRLNKAKSKCALFSGAKFYRLMHLTKKPARRQAHIPFRLAARKATATCRPGREISKAVKSRVAQLLHPLEAKACFDDSRGNICRVPHDAYSKANLSNVSPRNDHQFKKVGIPSAHTNLYFESFIPKTANEWNHLPAPIAAITDVTLFKNSLCNHFV